MALIVEVPLTVKGQAIGSVKVRLIVIPLQVSFAETVKLKELQASVGIPLISPVVEFRVSVAGRLPLVRLYLYGGLPPCIPTLAT